MSRREKDAIRRNRVYLVQHLDNVHEIVNYLRQERIISTFAMDEILLENNRTNQVRCLLDVLPNRGPRCFRVFLRALVKYHQDEAAKLLDRRVAEELIDIRPPVHRSSPTPVRECPDTPPDAEEDLLQKAVASILPDATSAPDGYTMTYIPVYIPTSALNNYPMTILDIH